MRQCLLQLNNRHKIAWIPNKFATVGSFLRIHEENGWKVIAVWGYQDYVHGQRGYFAGGIGR